MPLLQCYCFSFTAVFPSWIVMGLAEGLWRHNACYVTLRKVATFGFAVATAPLKHVCNSGFKKHALLMFTFTKKCPNRKTYILSCAEIEPASKLETSANKMKFFQKALEKTNQTIKRERQSGGWKHRLVPEWQLEEESTSTSEVAYQRTPLALRHRQARKSSQRRRTGPLFHSLYIKVGKKHYNEIH